MATSLCFVCDERVGSDRVHLATSLAPHSKLGLAAKISNLIGDDFVVVVTQSDHVCRRCSALLNHMDKLEQELNYIKKALNGYIRNKYNLPIDGDSKNVVQNGDVSPAKKAKTPIQPTKHVSATPTPARNSSAQLLPDEPPKLKIYKCGFCSFQSRELNSVRIHMKVHVRSKTDENKKILPKIPTTPVQTAVTIPTPPQATTNLVRKKLFRCQVCSASFVDRKSCLQHIKLTHSNKSSSSQNKENEQSSNSTASVFNNQDATQGQQTFETQGNTVTDSVNSQDDSMQLDQHQPQHESEQSQEEPMDDDQQHEDGTSQDPLGDNGGAESQGEEGSIENQDELTQDSQEALQENGLGDISNETASADETSKMQNEADGEPKEEMDIEDIMAALHADTNTNNSEPNSVFNGTL